MDSNLDAYATQATCLWLHRKYGYSEKECQAYIKGYEDCRECIKEFDNIRMLNTEYLCTFIPDETTEKEHNNGSDQKP